MAEDGGYITFTHADSKMFVQNENVEMEVKRKQAAIRVSRSSFNSEVFKTQQIEEDESNIMPNVEHHQN